MNAVLIAIAISAQGQAPQPKAFEHVPTNIKFNLPESAKVQRRRNDTLITFPVQGGKGTAELQVFAVSFMAEPSVWEGSQKYFVDSQRQTMLGQTKEEVLGVPLLLTKFQETATPARKITLSGLLYSKSTFKFAFRLSASEDLYADAEYKWRESMTSVATIDGILPEPEVPNRTAEAPATPRKPLETPENVRTVLGNAGATSAGPIIAAQFYATKVANRDVEFRFPDGWKLESGEKGIVASHPDVTFPVSVELHSSLESPNLSSAFMARTVKDLDNFSTVKKREEIRPRANAAGATIYRMTREGVGNEGPIFSFISGGEKGIFYWIATFSGKQAPDAKAMKAINALIDSASIEQKP